MAGKSQRQEASSAPKPSTNTSKDDWEDWEDDECITPIDMGEQVLIQDPYTYANSKLPTSHATKSFSSRISRQSTTNNIQRLKSRKRQKAQNAKAGIKLVTDMTALRRKNQTNHNQPPPPHESDSHVGKFVDAAALKALEGEPNSASVGNWNWLKRNKSLSPSSADVPQSAASALSPEDRPIVIGLAMSAIEPSMAATKFRSDLSPDASKPNDQQKSVWSPDTPSTASSFSPGPRPVSSLYSQVTGQTIAQGQAPPVPVVPDTYKQAKNPKLVSLELGNSYEDESTSPYTLFEEDGVPSPKHQGKGKLSAVTPDSAASKSHGWWDHVVTPFADKRLTFTRRKAESPQEQFASPKLTLGAVSDPEPSPSLIPRPLQVAAPIIRAPTPKRTPSPPIKEKTPFDIHYSSDASTSRGSPAIEQRMTREKPRIVVTSDHHDLPPPPYSSPKNQVKTPTGVKYRAVFPPGHPAYSQFPPSPGLGSPGLSATMTSQGATPLSEMHNATEELPARPVGTYLPREHAFEAPGTSFGVERDRRRHEKEDVVARKVGGLWRGRGCIPESGCFGRTGPEGRKRRRICLGIWSGVIALIIMIIILAVVLTRPKNLIPQEIDSIWVNLTQYPPMPTGVQTIVGPDNTIAESGCTRPSTMWSCSLPKEAQSAVEPYKPNQPMVIMQIQYDNNTRQAWRVANDDPPRPISRRSSGLAAMARSLLRGKRDIEGFTPNPDPPAFKEMFFLGETTDNITAEEKGGEPTPFYISLLTSVNDTVGFPTQETPLRQERREITEDDDDDDDKDSIANLLDRLPPPQLNDDGTPTAARLLPNPVQQPVRLYDRGLPTEHYGFYTYFRRTIFLKSVTRLNETDDGDVPIDEEGGARKTEAAFMTTWGETRLRVQIWTQTLERNQSSLIAQDTNSGRNLDLIRPGSMPYPVTVSLDTHGGDPDKKVVWEWPMDERQRLDLKRPQLLANDISFGGEVINPRGGRNSTTEEFGGFDGGGGGCKCEWANWV